MKSGIYTITNLINGKIYIGMSKNLNSRKSKHFYELRTKTHDNEYLQNSWKKYGQVNFIFEVLEYYDIEYLPSMEHYWCNLLNTHDRNFGYNIKPTHPCKFNLVSDETKRKMSLLHKGKKMSIEARKKMSDYHKNNPLSEERKIKLQKARNKVGISAQGRLNISKANKERKREKVSEITRNKISIANRGRKLEFKKRKFSLRIGKSVIQLDFENNIVKYYDKISDVEKDNFNQDSVIRVCKGKKKDYKGFIWRYKTDGYTKINY